MGAFNNALVSRLRRPAGFGAPVQPQAAPMPQPMPVQGAQGVMPSQAQGVPQLGTPAVGPPVQAVGTPAPAPQLPGAPVAGMPPSVAGGAPPLNNGIQPPAPGAIAAPPQQPMQNAWLQRMQQMRGMQAM